MIINVPDSVYPYLGEGFNPKTNEPGLWLIEGTPEEVVKVFEEFMKIREKIKEPSKDNPWGSFIL